MKFQQINVQLQRNYQQIDSSHVTQVRRLKILSILQLSKLSIDELSIFQDKYFLYIIILIRNKYQIQNQIYKIISLKVKKQYYYQKYKNSRYIYIIFIKIRLSRYSDNFLQAKQMINPLFLPQNSPYRKKTNNKSSTLSLVNQHRQFKVIHQLDSIYQGQINQSYKFQGFGIVQTHNFQMYIGFWKGSKINGVGIIIYPQGYLIYGNFKDNQLEGIVITDNKAKLKVFNYYQGKIIGAGYQYDYLQKTWKFIKFHLGVPIETISSIIKPLQNGIPSMFNINQDMYLFLGKYIKQEYFDCSYKNILEKAYKPYTQMNVHNLGQNQVYFGQMVEGKQWGVGIIYNNKNGVVKEAGFYENNQFNGYALQIDHQKNKIEIGPYFKGKKNGFFFKKVHHLQCIIQYQNNFIKGQRPQFNRTNISHYQKIYNYQKNDYLSEKNKIKFKQYLKFFDQGQKIKFMEKVYGKKQKTPNKNKKSQMTRQNIEKNAKNTQNAPAKKNLSPKTTAIISYQVSTVNYIREKFSNLDKILKRSKNSFNDQKDKNSKSNTNIKLNVHKNIQNSQIRNNSKQIIQNSLKYQQIQSQEQPVTKLQRKKYPYAQRLKLFDKYPPYKQKMRSQKFINHILKTEQQNRQKTNQQIYQSPNQRKIELSQSPKMRKTSPRPKKPIFN